MIEWPLFILIFLAGFMVGASVLQSISNDQAKKGFYTGNGKVYSVTEMETIKKREGSDG